MAVGAAFTGRRVFEPVEARILVTSGVMLLALSILFAFYPHAPAYTLAFLLSWVGLALLYRGYILYGDGKRK
jgi:cardiolipin synthase